VLDAHTGAQGAAHEERPGHAGRPVRLGGWAVILAGDGAEIGLTIEPWTPRRK